MSKDVYLDAPKVGRLEKLYLARAVDTGYISTAGPFVSQLEKEFARYLGVRNAASTQSGTAALHVALYELGIGKGDEVIVPALTFVATVSPILYVGAKPVFADVDIDTWTIDPSEIEDKITKRTKAVIPVHLYGNPCDMDAIMKIAGRYRLHVIEDATESLGARYGREYTGTIGDFGCFSFNGNKVITTGGGGMVVGKDRARISHIKFLVNQARENSADYYYPEVGFNYRMTNLEAAVGLAQIQRLNGFLAKKRKFHTIYKEELGDIPSIRFQEEREGSMSQRWLTCVTFEDGIDVSAIQKRLDLASIPTRRVFMPVAAFPPYKRYTNNPCMNSFEIYKKGLCLPGSMRNSQDDIRRVCAAVKKALKGMR